MFQSNCWVSKNQRSDVVTRKTMKVMTIVAFDIETDIKQYYTMFPLEPVRTRTGFFSSLPNSNGHGSALLSHLKPGSNQFANSYEFEFPVRTEMSTRTHMGSNWWEWMNICSGNTFQFQNGLILNTILQNLF